MSKNKKFLDDDLIDQLNIREITEEDLKFYRYAVMLFLRLYIDEPIENYEEKLQPSIKILQDALNTFNEQLSALPEEILRDLVEKTLICIKFDDVMIEKEENNVDEEKILH